MEPTAASEKIIEGLATTCQEEEKQSALTGRDIGGFDMRWKLSKHYFHGPGVYEVGYAGNLISISVDKDGYFDLKELPNFPLGVYAGRMIHQSTSDH